MDHLKHATNEATLARVRALIKKKLKNQMNNMTKTDTQFKMGMLDGEILYWLLRMGVGCIISLTAINVQRKKSGS